MGVNMSLQNGVNTEEQAIESAKQESEKTAKQIKKKGIEPFLEVPTEQIEEELSAQNTPQAPQKPQTAKNTLDEENRVYGTNMKPQKQSFSFRAEQSKIENWKLYAETVCVGDVGALWTAALDEYIDRHKLTAEQQIIYNLKKQVLEKQKELSANKM